MKNTALHILTIIFLVSTHSSLFSQSNERVVIDSLIKILNDESLAVNDPLKVENTIKQVGTLKISIATKAAPQIAIHLDRHVYIQDTLAFLQLKEGYTPSIPFEYLYPATKTAKYIGEPILPFILFHIVNEENINEIYVMNALHVLDELIGSNLEIVAYIKKYGDRLPDNQKRKLYHLVNSISRN